MAAIVPAVSVMFGSAKSPKAKKANPTKMKPPMVPMPDIGAALAHAPSHQERLHSAAADEHVNAARDFVAGRISHAQFADRKSRAAKVMGKTPKSTK